MRRATLSEPPLFAVTARTRARVTLTADTGAVAHVFVLEDDIVRLLLLADGTLGSPPSWAIACGAEDIAEPGRDRMSVAGFSCPDFELDNTEDILTIATARISLTIDLNGLRCRWEQMTPAGWRLMAEDRPTQAYDFGWWDGRVHHYTVRQPGERYYGLGERAGGMDRGGRRFRMLGLDPMGYDAETSDPLYKSIPYVLTAQADGACHGAFIDTLAEAVFDFGAELDNYHGPYRHFVAEHGDLDLYMIAGPDPAAVTRRYTWLTGRPARMPRWSLGYSGSTMSYTDAPDAQAQMAGFIHALRQHDIGCTSFHLSSGYTSIAGKRYVFNWNRDKFPDPARFAADYAAAGIRLVANIKPALLTDHPRYAEAAAAGLLVADAAGVPTETQFWDAIGSYVDFTNSAGAAWWRARVTDALLEVGIAATWNDNNEYEIWDARAMVAGFGSPRPAAEVRPLQGLLMTRASRAAQIAFAPGDRPYVVSRSGMAGLQRYAATWSGDNRTAWATLRYNLKMGLGLALSGMSNSGHDVGGFAGPAPDAELLIRWVQAGILMPRFSIHSWNDDATVNEPWMYAEALPAIRELMALRQLLVPFLDDLLHRYTRDFEPMLRPAWLDHPDDVEAWADTDDHLLGRDLLAALVVEPGARRRTIRLPGSDDWYEVATGRVVAGGVTIDVAAPLQGLPPLFARAGSGIFVDLANGGFAPGPRERGVWLFPPVGEAEFRWRAIEDDGEGASREWRIDGRTTRGSIALVVSCDGPAAADMRLTIILPRGDSRTVAVEGGVSAVTDVGRSPTWIVNLASAV